LRSVKWREHSPQDQLRFGTLAALGGAVSVEKVPFFCGKQGWAREKVTAQRC